MGFVTSFCATSLIMNLLLEEIRLQARLHRIRLKAFGKPEKILVQNYKSAEMF